MKLKKNDFIEINFTARLKQGDIFDSNIKEDIEKSGLKTKPEPFIFALGQGMFLKSLDEFLIDKEPGKTYEVELSPEKAFGIRDAKLIQLMPLSVFKKHNLKAIPGMMYNFDGRLAKVLSVSGGRIRVDFNHPLAGKEVNYTIKVNRKLDNINEKIKAMNKFLFKKEFKFEIKDKKVIMHVETPLVKFVEMFKEKFKEIFNLDLEVKELKENKSK